MYFMVISPTYLDYLKEEARGFSFKFQGYGNFESAKQGLLKVNTLELGGVALVMDALPEKRKSLKEFLSALNLCSDKSVVKRRVVFALVEDSDLIPFLKKGNWDNLDFYLAQFEILTDVVIKQEVYGTLMYAHQNLYEDQYTQSSYQGVRSLKPLKPAPLFPPALLDVVSDVALKPTLERTVSEDPVLPQLKSTGEIYYLLRLYFLQKNFGAEQQTEELLEELLTEKKPSTEKTQYELFYKFVRERR